MAALTRNCNAKCGFSTTSAFNSSICDDATAVGGAGSTGVLLLEEDELLLESVVSRPLMTRVLFSLSFFSSF